MPKSSQCQFCMYNEYDEEYGEEYCTVALDEDELYRYMSKKTSTCPYFKNGDEYSIVKKQN